MSSSPADMSPYRPVQDGLRAAGRYLDENNRRLVSLLVVGEGIVVTLTSADAHKGGEAVLLTHDDLRTLSEQFRAARGSGNAPSTPDHAFPTGYEDFLRALGVVATHRDMSLLRLIRVGDFLLIRHGPQVKREELVLDADAITAMLNQAFKLRGQGPVA